MLASPAARYFAIGRIGQDQVEDYAGRKGMPVSEVEYWLRPNLAYEPGPSAAPPAPAQATAGAA
jgi:5-methyltetrahydrofolate--homocysteine methyltransferase